MILYLKQHTFEAPGYIRVKYPGHATLPKPLRRDTSGYAAFMVGRRGCIFSMKAAIYALTKQAVLNSASHCQNTPALLSRYKSFIYVFRRRGESSLGAFRFSVKPLQHSGAPGSLHMPFALSFFFLQNSSICSDVTPALHAAPRSTYSFQETLQSRAISFVRLLPRALCHFNTWMIESLNAP